MSSDPTQSGASTSAHPHGDSSCETPRDNWWRRLFSPKKPPDARQRRILIVIQLVALASVLGAHTWERVKDVRAITYEQRRFYQRDYQVSIAIAIGRGFTALRLDDAAGAPLEEFLQMKRQRIEPAELAEYDRADRARPGAFPSRMREHTARTLELYVMGGLWRVFGVDWRVHTTFYVFVSAVCCLLIFHIARRISGSFGCGFTAAILYCALPYESFYLAVSMRDVNPLWFAIIAYWFVACVADRFESRWACAASYFGTGVASILGVGYRPDATMIPPVILVTLVAVLVWNKRRWFQVLLAVLLFAGGVKATTVALDRMAPDDALPRGRWQFLHVSYYADATRSIILDYENSFQTLRSDDFVWTLADEFHKQEPIEERDEWDHTLWGPTYSDLMFRLFRDMGQYHLYDWAMAMPGAYVKALTNASGPEGRRFAIWLPWVAILGAFPGVLVYRARAPLVLSLFGFSLYYCAVFIAVLPEEKHLAPFILPLCVLGALGLWIPLAWLDARDRPKFELPFRFTRRRVISVAVLIAIVAGGCLVTANRLAYAKRQEYIAAVRSCTDGAIDVREKIADRRVFSTTVEFSREEQRGYLLDITAGAEPGYVVMRNLPEGTSPAPAYETRHALEPGVRQQFFWSCYRGWVIAGNPRSHYTVRLTGDAEIVRARELDLGAWERLPFATVFTDDDTHAGSPDVDVKPALRILDQSVDRNEWGLTYLEAIITSLGAPSRIVAGRDHPACQVKPIDSARGEVVDDGTWIFTRPEPIRYQAIFGTFTAPESGRYVFRLDTRTEKGEFFYALLTEDQSTWVILAERAEDVASDGEVQILLCDMEAGQSVVPVITNASRHIESKYLVRGLEIRKLLVDPARDP